MLAYAALAVAIATAFAAAWIVIPPPTYGLLVLGVGAPEVSVFLLIVGLGAAIVAAGPARGHSAAKPALVLAAATVVLALFPLLKFPSIARRFDAAMSDALGPGFLDGVPEEARRTMRSRPFSAADLFRGIDLGESRITTGVEFATPAGHRLTLDVYQPLSAGHYPVVVQIYGGAWQAGAPGDYPNLARYLAARGYVVFAIDYRHAPEWQWPTQITDVRAALAWIHDHAAQYDADTARMALLGRSAGAQLALVAAYEPEEVPIRAVVSFYGPTDLEDGYRHPPHPDPLGVQAINRAFLGGTPDEVPAKYRDASPITHVAPSLPPTLLLYGGRDNVVEPRFGRLLDERLRSAGAISVYLEIPWAEHAFDAVPNGPSAQLALYHIERFLAWALRAP